MDVAIITMGETLGKFPMLEHCCYGLSEKKLFPVEAALFFSALKERGSNAKFFDGNVNSEEEILTMIKNDSPKKIIYYLYTPYIRHKIEFLKKLSEISKVNLIIMPYFWKDKILKEFPFIENVFYDGEKASGIDIKNTKIDYDKFDLSPYLDRGSFFVFVSKYCPYQCTYCNAQRTGLMERDIKIVEDEIIYLKNRGFKKFRMVGNDLTANKKTFFSICGTMKKIGVEWSGDGRVNHMTDDMYLPLKESRGTLLFGIESANQKVLDEMKKKITIEQIITNAQKMNKLKIPFRYDFIFGFPEDSYQTAKEMIELRTKTGELNYHCNILAAYPDTPIFQKMKELNLVKEADLDFEDFSWLNAPVASTIYLTKEEVKELTKKIMVKGIFNKSVFKNILMHRQIKEYPRIASRGLKILIYGKRSWRK